MLALVLYSFSGFPWWLAGFVMLVPLAMLLTREVRTRVAASVLGAMAIVFVLLNVVIIIDCERNWWLIECWFHW